MVRYFSFYLLFLVFGFSLTIADEKIPLNKNQQNLVNEFNICSEEYSLCELNILKKLVKTSNEKTEYYDIFIYNLVERLILVGDLKDWFDYKDLIENYIESSTDETDSLKVYLSSLWGWRLYSIKELRDYKKSLKYLESAISTKGNDEMTGTAYYSLGVMYEQGRSVKKDIQKSIKYFEEAIKRGEYYAYRRIALNYILGDKFVAKNFSKAVKYIKLTNSSWVTNSDISLLKIFYKNRRLPKDISEFEKWIVKDYKLNKNKTNFIYLAIAYERSKNYKKSYQFHYINTLLNNEDNAAAVSVYELENYKDLFIKPNEISNIETQAKNIINLKS